MGDRLGIPSVVGFFFFFSFSSVRSANWSKKESSVFSFLLLHTNFSYFFTLKPKSRKAKGALQYRPIAEQHFI